MKISWQKLKNLAVATLTIAAFYPNSVSAQIVKDATLPNNSSITTRDNIKVITGGTEAGSNLFHSFEQFSVPTNTTAYFDNAANIQNIITRITGKSISNIDGILRANGTANLFLINPNGIVFGENAALDIGGSFLATTANSINFADGTKFSATQPQTAPLLTINVPTGLQFGSTAAPIRNQSQASPDGATNFFGEPVGLQVPTGKTLALIGGDVTLEDGNLTADTGRIELGSVANDSLVSLNSIDKGWTLGYEGVENFQNIQIIGRNIDEGTIVDVSGEDGDGSIRVQGNSVNLIGGRVRLQTVTEGTKNAGDLTINARKLIIRGGAQITSFTDGSGAGGNLVINASESVEIIGGFSTSTPIDRNFPSGLFSFAGGSGTAGNIIINTLAFLVKDGAVISTESSGIRKNSQFFPATGEGGNITVNANESVELVGSSTSFPSSLIASTSGVANAGKITISTKQLIVRDEAEISVSSLFPNFPQDINFFGDTSNLGNAGELKITADSILLDNQGKLISETESANGGNINLQLKDLLLLRRNSQISTNAGKAQLDGNGGNININIPNGFIVAVPEENSDITANAFTGSGGRVDITANGIFGIQPRSRDELTELLSPQNPSELNPQELLTSDITAISQQNPNLNGELNIVAQDVEPTRELVELPETPVDTMVSQVCRFSRGNQSEFVYIRGGGLPTLPGEVLRGDSGLGIGWVDGGGEGEREGVREGERERGRVTQNPIVEATGWMKNKNGDIFFVADKNELNGKSFNQAGCS